MLLQQGKKNMKGFIIFSIWCFLIFVYSILISIDFSMPALIKIMITLLAMILIALVKYLRIQTSREIING